MKWVVIDFDGTLVDLKVDWDSLRKNIANYFLNRGIVTNLFPLTLGIELALAQSKNYAKDLLAVQNMITKAEELGSERSEVINGSVELLAGLKKMDYKVGIYSSNDEDIVARTLSKHGLVSDLVVGRKNGHKAKPDNSATDVLLKKLGKGKVLMVIGDSDSDEQVAKYLKVEFVSVSKTSLQDNLLEIFGKL